MVHLCCDARESAVGLETISGITSELTWQREIFFVLPFSFCLGQHAPAAPDQRVVVRRPVKQTSDGQNLSFVIVAPHHADPVWDEASLFRFRRH